MWKTLSWSDTIDFGGRPHYPKELEPSLELWMDVLSGMKSEYLIKRSTTTKIVSNPSDFGRASMKSIVTSYHTPCGMGNGCSNPVSRVWLVLACWHIAHCWTNRVTSCFSPVHTNNFRTRWYVTWILKWPPSALAWNVAINFVHGPELWPTQMRVP
jgi:hypothetical protein